LSNIDEEGYGYKVELETFSGPLDLLLYLIRQEEVDITDIPIARITEQYLRHLEILRQINVNLAGEFLVMAATLMEIKSRMLLPRREGDEEEEEDPRADLIRQLIEYKRFKDAARQLSGRLDEQALRFTRGAAAALGLPERQPEEDLPVLLGEVSVWDLLGAFKLILRQTSVETAARVVLDQRPASFHCNAILERFRQRPSLTFRELFERGASRATLINVFLALLELIRRRRIRAEQPTHGGEIRIFLLDDTPVSESELTEERAPAEAEAPHQEPTDQTPAPAAAEDEAPVPDAELDEIHIPDAGPHLEPLDEAPSGTPERRQHAVTQAAEMPAAPPKARPSEAPSALMRRRRAVPPLSWLPKPRRSRRRPRAIGVVLRQRSNPSRANA